jgi:hypothetical protein
MKAVLRFLAGALGVAFFFGAGLVLAMELEGRTGFNPQTGVFVAMTVYGGLLVLYAARGRFP